ncbi:hypothetical protein AMJ85_02610 [candidate division BRC1 bacterium SM23_51]|nr:MAG: hypothetical protein AMJ85_02610 [candidate division BRC1 bacterium SM23_51]
MLCVGFLALCCSVVFAVPAPDKVITLKQPDGTAILVRLFGDEFYHWHEADDGYTVIQDQQGWWCYAVKDAQGDLVAGPQRVAIDRRPVTLQRRLRPDDQVLAQRIYEGKRARGYFDARLAPVVPEGPPEEIDRPPVRVEPRGTVNNLVILCYFSDHSTTANYCRPASEYGPLFNQVGHSTDGAVGSVRDYYYEISYGNLTMVSTTTAWLALPGTKAYYGQDSGPNTDINVTSMVVMAINLADAAGVDFSQYDTDGDNWIDAIDIIHSGYGQESTGVANDIWSHRGWVGDSLAVNPDGVWISGYHTEPALRGTAGQNIIRIGVICHETGHFYGLPDLYDTDGATGGYGNGIGAWGIMASGSWGANGSTWPERPVHMCGWSKMQLGWIDPTPIHTKNSWSLSQVETNAVSYIVREGLPDAEHFLVSNRQATGFDSQLLNSGGLEILHIDESQLDNNTTPSLKVEWEEADGNWSLRNQATGSRAQAGDPWPGSASQTTFGPATTPDTNSNPAHGGSPSSVTVSSISASADPMTFDLQSLVPWVDVPSSDPDGNFNVTWTSSANATQYELQEGTTSTVSTYSDNCNSETVFRNDWIARGAVRRVVPPTEGDSVYLMQLAQPPFPGGTFYDEFQSLQLRKKFRVTASTTISYDIKYGFNNASASTDCGVGYFQIRRTTETTWTTLTKFSTYGLGSWNSWTETSGELSSFVGSECEVRFLVINNAGTVWFWYPGSWPHDGMAIEDFSINSAQLSDYSWSTVSGSATSPYASSKGNGIWSYRVRARAGGSWQDWSNVDAVQVGAGPTITSATVEDLGTATGTDTGLAAADSGYANERSVRIAVLATGGTPTQIRVAESAGALSAASYVAFTYPNYDSYQLSDSDGGKDIWVQVQDAGGASNQYNIGGNTNADIVLDRVAPASTGVTAPAPAATVTGGGSTSINWNAFTDTNGVKTNSVSLDYDTSSGGGGYPNSIATGEADDGSYSWSPVAAINSTTVRVRATAYDVGGTSGSATSSGDFTISSPFPTVNSIVRADTNPTSVSSVNFTVTFSEGVLNVDTSDFAIDASGVSGASISGVSGSGASRTVSVGTGTGDGTLSIDLIDDDSIVDAATGLVTLGGAGAGNGSYTSGEDYTIDKTAPDTTVTGPAGTTVPLVVFDVTFTAVETGSGLRAAHLYYQKDGAGGYLQYGSGFASSPISFDSSSTGANGIYEFYTIGIDNASNVESAPVSADLIVTVDAAAAAKRWQLY